jgi:TetR/AcrR family transcriptional repressor of nem operon
MRRSREDTAETRREIVAAASRLFRKNGIAATSIADVMGALDMTVGGFYRHFEDKDQLVAEAIAHASSVSSKTITSEKALVRAYLSKEHCEHPERGCPVAALCSEIGHEGRVPRHAFTSAVRAMIAALEPTRDDREERLAELATAVGALVLARAVDDPKLRDEILAAARKTIEARDG